MFAKVTRMADWFSYNRRHFLDSTNILLVTTTNSYDERVLLTKFIVF